MHICSAASGTGYVTGGRMATSNHDNLIFITPDASTLRKMVRLQIVMASCSKQGRLVCSAVQ